LRIYITHCSAKKNDSFKLTKQKITPDKLYTTKPIQRFMNRCKEKSVNWAIFSDLYGIWFPDIEHEWYEKDPNKVTEKEYKNLLNDFDQKLQDYSEIWFYHNPGRFHSLYERLISESKLKIIKFTHIEDID
jgi:hypothetical protein